MKCILHPSDFSDGSEQVFRLICPIAREQHAGIVVLHVLAPHTVPLEDRRDGFVAQDSPLYRRAWSEFCRLREMAGDVPLSLQVKFGPLVDTIANVARQECCELIGVAWCHHDHAARLYHPGIPECLMRIAPCSVLCLKESPVQSESRRFMTGLQHPRKPDCQKEHKPELCERQW